MTTAIIGVGLLGTAAARNLVKGASASFWQTATKAKRTKSPSSSAILRAQPRSPKRSLNRMSSCWPSIST